MKIEMKNISVLVDAEYNPRRMTTRQLGELEKSFRNLGTLEPAVINMQKGRENVIISGHQRIRVAKKLGMKEYPCLCVKFPLEKEKEANVRLNKNTGEWDFDILSKEFNHADLVDWGFDEDLFDDMILEPDKKTGHADIEETGIIQVNVIFDTREQLSMWYKFQKKINDDYEEETFAGRLTQFIEGLIDG